MAKRVKGFAGLKLELTKLEKRFGRETKRAYRNTARKTAAHLRRNIPVAHGELRDSVDANPMSVTVDAPHAVPVEVGSRPHWPPLAPLIEWVKLRGMQGLVNERSRARLPGTTTRSHAADVASMISAAESGGAVGVDVPERIARAIQASIAKHGTKPHWYGRNSVPAARGFLNTEIHAALRRMRVG